MRISRLRSLAVAVLLCAPGATSAEVFVESSQVLLYEQRNVPPGQYLSYPLNLQRGTSIAVGIRTTGGTSPLQLWLINPDNLRQFAAGQGFRPLAQQIEGAGGLSATVAVTGAHYLILDNRSSPTVRRTSVRVEASSAEPSPEAAARKQAYEARYAVLRDVFVFDDFDVHVASCGQSNAFSTPSIVMCRELIDELQRMRVPGAEQWLFHHEAGHSLLRLWGYPLSENEDAADEFATVMSMLGKRDEEALHAAQWWSQKPAGTDVQAKLWIDDRHSLSPQRARNIVNWLKRGDELKLRWLRILIPNMTNGVLTRLAREEPESEPEAAILAQIRRELDVRKRSGMSASPMLARRETAPPASGDIGGEQGALPVDVSFRKRSGSQDAYVAQLENRSGLRLIVKVIAENAQLGQRIERSLDLPAERPIEFGPNQNWMFKSGETLTVEVAGYAPLALKVP